MSCCSAWWKQCTQVTAFVEECEGCFASAMGVRASCCCQGSLEFPQILDLKKKKMLPKKPQLIMFHLW